MKMNYISNKHKNQEIEQNFSKQVEIMRNFEDKMNGYLFISPKSAEDMRDEASQQSNCLATYIDRVANGERHIIFMRKEDEPEKSLVTIEIFPNGEVGQVKAARNKNPDVKYMEVVRKWAQKHNLSIA